MLVTKSEFKKKKKWQEENITKINIKQINVLCDESKLSYKEREINAGTKELSGKSENSIGILVIYANDI